MAKLVFDCEVYKDYYLIAFKDIETGAISNFELYDGHPLDTATVMSILRNNLLASFNGRTYDMPLTMLACMGESNQRIKDASDTIIVKKLQYWTDEFKQEFPEARYGRDEFDHIDLIDVAPGQASLKIYGGRLHSRRMQDLPIDPSDSITPELRPKLVEYCGNDLQTTVDLYRTLTEQIDLRIRMGEQYGIDLRSKSDAQIAEQVIRGLVQKKTGNKISPPVFEPGTQFQYKAPEFVSFMTQQLRDVLSAIEASYFFIAGTGAVEMSDVLAKTKISIGSSVYRMGIGGLHSSETCAAHVAEGCRIYDRDVTSYYPSIILKGGLYPKQMGPYFLTVYRGLFNGRIQAKASARALQKQIEATSGDEAADLRKQLVVQQVKADSNKLSLNGSFGKLGSKYSSLYSPALLIQTTVTGQLCLLMLIEHLEACGIPVVSANTDGIVIKCPPHLEDTMLRVIWAWELVTGFETEETAYAAVYSRDVNNYIALKEKGGVKLKGAFAPPGLQKNPTCQICVDAAVDFLELGVPVESTIMGCTDVRKFVSVRKVTGGAMKNDEYLGRAIRWYYALGTEGVITMKSSGYTVAKTEGAKPLMVLPDVLPDDVDHGWYIREAKSILNDVGWRDA
jgi:hypothetical protein